MSSNSPQDERRNRSKPETFRARSMSASLTVKDLQKTLAWYRDIVGFTVGEEYMRDGKLLGVQLKAGNVECYVSQDDGAKGQRIVGLGFSMGFVTEQNIDEMAGKIKSRGGQLDMEPTDMPWGARVFRIKDPDGYMLTISSDVE